MTNMGILFITILTLSIQGRADDQKTKIDPSRDALPQVEQALKMYPDLSTASIAAATRKSIEFRNGDHDDSSKITVTILDGKRAQISCVSRFAVGTDSPDVKKIQNGYPFSKEDLDVRSDKWFYGTTRIIGENAELIRKIASFMGPDSPVTGEHRETILSTSSVFDRCLKLEKALQAANTHFERVAFSHSASLPDYRVTSSNKEIDGSLLDKKVRRD